MSLLQTIKADQLVARKNKDVLKAKLLTTLIGEATAIGKNDGNRETTDSEATAVVKKFIKNINETLDAKPGDETSVLEKQILETYLPKQLSSDELTTIVEDLKIEIGASSPRDMGKMMQALKSQYDGQYDGKMASQIVKDSLL